MAQMEDQEYGRYQDQLSQYYTDLNYLTENARYMSETEYQKALDAFNIKYGAYWDQKNFDESVRQYDEQMELQKKNSVGSPYTYDSDYEDYTPPKYTPPNGWNEATVREFQNMYGLEQDGVFGPKTSYVYDLVADLNEFISEGEPKSKISAVLREELNSGKISRETFNILQRDFVPKEYTY
jgi:peptidoglycan hydrolase-like protein with peptidoglycan-binding domain